jgi:methylated-DNA-[protein]-cysteine S-methyltransferase
MRIAPWWESDAAPFIDVRAQLREYFAAERAVFDDVPLAMAGTSFERRAWHELQSLPYGNTASYGEIARRVGDPAPVASPARLCTCRREPSGAE